jgi:NAD(P)-dependent dehydrogenase (short-subunit alcohol dehydrogenase family)
MRVAETLQELVTPHGTIGVMSSGQGSVTNNDKGGFEVYRASKSASNQLMRSFAARHASDPRTLLLMAGCRPTWAAPPARLTIGQSIPGVADMIEAQAAKGGPCNTWTTRVRPSAGSACGPPLMTWRTTT